jgi:hypothetical protein
MFNRSKTTAYRTTGTAGVSIRWTSSDADGELARVAARDSQILPDGPWLVAEVEGSPLAVLSLADGAFVADPFSRTVELRALLELRADQLATRDTGSRPLFGRPRNERVHGSGMAPRTSQPVTLAPRPRF